MAAPTTTNEVTVRRLSEVLVGSDGNGGIKKAVDDKITAAVEALDVAEVGGDGKYIKKIKEDDGKITATVETMDTSPTASSTKAVTSGGVKTALDGKEDTSNKVSTWSSTTNNTRYPGEKLVKDSLDAKENVSNKITAWQSTPSDTKYPSEKLVKTSLNNKAETYTISQPAEYKSFVCITDLTQWYDESGTRNLSAGYQMIGQWSMWRSGGGYDAMDCFYMLYHLNYRWKLNDTNCFELYSTRPPDITPRAFPAILRDARDANNVKYYFGFKIKPAWNNTLQFTGRLRDINFNDVQWIEGATSTSTDLPTGCTLLATPSELKWSVETANKLKTARDLQVNLASSSAASFDGSANVTIGVSGTLPVANGGTGQTSLANVTVGKATNADITRTADTTNGDKLQIGNGTSANIVNAKHAASADSATSATSATNVNLSGDVKTTSTTNGDTIRVKAGSGTAAEITIINAKHAASADSATSATTATDYNTSTGTIKSALDGKASSTHTHGNITNAGTITADTAIANGTKIATVGTDNKVSRSPISFDGSTTTTALTPKGTFEAFAKSGDITSAINALDVSSVGGAGKYISAIAEQDGKISATATSMDTAPTASSTNAVTSGGIKTALDEKVNVASVCLDNQTTTILSKVQELAATPGNHYCRWYTTGDNAAENISDKPGTGKQGFVVEALCNRRGSAADWRYVLLGYSLSTKPKIAWVTNSSTSISWSDLDSHWTTHLYAGSGTAANAETTNGNTKITVTDNSTVRNSVTLTGTNGVSVASNSSGTVTITGTKVESSSTNGNIKINDTETTVYTHPTTDGNKHVPSGGSSGNFLKYSAAGTATWSNIAASDIKSGQVAVANGGTGASDASGARTNLSVYSKSEVDSMLGGRIEIVASLPSTGSPGVIYYVGPSGSGGDQYDEYIWDTTSSSFIKVGEHSIDLSNYVNTLTKSGSGSVVTSISKSGNTITWTQGNISLDNLSTWASTSDVTISSKSYHTYWPTAPTSSNQVYGVSITDGKLYQIYNNKGTYSVRSYDQDTDTTYTNEKLGQGYGTCSTAEATAAKVVTLANYELVKGGIVAVKFTNGLCASATLNVNSKGAKTIYIHGAAATSTTAKEVKSGDLAYFMYDGTYYQFLGTDRMTKEAVTGISISGTTVTITKADGSTSTQTTKDTTYTFDGTYDSSTNKAATVSTVTNAINALDVSSITGFGAGKTLATLTETDGKIAATFQNISITKSQVSDFSHTHGNITNAGTITADTAIANGTKLATVGTDNKVARSPITFNGSTTTTALTPKGTFESFAKQADIDTAIGNIPSLSLVGDNHVTVSSDSTTGTVTIATDIGTQTAYSAKGTATKVPQITTNSLGQVTGITEVTISGVTPASHASSATTYGVGTTANYGHVKLATGDMNGASHADGVAVSKNHTHSQYQTVLTEMTETEVDNLLAVLT